MLVFLVALPRASLAQSSAVPAMAGSGSSAMDWLIGTWNCSSNLPPSAMSGPAKTTLTVSRNQASGGLALHLSGAGLDASGYLSYDPKTQTWWNPVSVGNGFATNESTKQTGATTVWTGSAVGSMGSLPMRDTYEQPDSSTYVDTTEMQIGGAWTTISKITCKKTP